jgi:hypothetical protein
MKPVRGDLHRLFCLFSFPRCVQVPLNSGKGNPVDFAVEIQRIFVGHA